MTSRRRRGTLGFSAAQTSCALAAPRGAASDSRNFCLEQLLEAFFDIADRDDIHQAAERLTIVRDWIEAEAARAAADPIFTASSLGSPARRRQRMTSASPRVG